MEGSTHVSTLSGRPSPARRRSIDGGLGRGGGVGVRSSPIERVCHPKPFLVYFMSFFFLLLSAVFRDFRERWPNLKRFMHRPKII